MAADGCVQVPRPYNEPIRPYEPGSPQRASLKAKLAELTDARVSVPMVIDGRRRAGIDTGLVRSPHGHELVVAEHAIAGDEDVDAAIEAALQARAEWGTAPYADRAAVL